jgi:hypothetical protein
VQKAKATVSQTTKAIANLAAAFHTISFIVVSPLRAAADTDAAAFDDGDLVADRNPSRISEGRHY